jgi:hypothetical protein
LLRWYLELVNAAAQAFHCLLPQLEFPSFPIVHERLEAVEAQGIRTLLARPLRDHNGTLETLDWTALTTGQTESPCYRVHVIEVRD